MIENVAEKMADNEEGSGQFGNSIVHSLTKGISFLYMQIWNGQSGVPAEPAVDHQLSPDGPDVQIAGQ